MRIPVGSCEGCNQDAGRARSVSLKTLGYHVLGEGRYMRCKFVEAEMADLQDVQLLGVYYNRKSAARIAKQKDAALLWVGQAPIEFWLVVRDTRPIA